MIPKVTSEALLEATKQINAQDHLRMKPNEWESYIKSYGLDLKEKQPELMSMVFQNINLANEFSDGYIKSEALFLVSAVLINALYIQEEIEDVGKLFNDWDK